MLKLHYTSSQFYAYSILEFVVAPLCDEIAARIPGLASLNLQTDTPIYTLGQDVIGLLESLKNLHRLVLPQFGFTTRVTVCVSTLGKLGCIEFHYSEEQGNGVPSDVEVCVLNLGRGVCGLWDVSLEVGYGDLRRFLTVPFTVSSVTVLYNESVRVETPEDVYWLLVAVSENCQMLKLLKLVSPRRRTLTVGEEDVDVTGRHVGMDTLKPLLACANFTSFEIIHQHPLLLKQQA